MAKARFVNKKVAVVAILAAGLFSAVLVGSASLASAQQERPGMPNISGSMNVKEQTRNFINENTNVSFIDAVAIAQEQAEDGKVVGGHLGVVQGYLVYVFVVTDVSGENGYKVVVDAGNGEVLHTVEGIPMGPFGSGMFGQWKGHGSWKAHGAGAMWQYRG